MAAKKQQAGSPSGQVKEEAFGDASLACPALLPLSPTERFLSGKALLPLWAVVAVNPYIYAFFGEASDGLLAIVRLSIALAGLGFLGFALTRTAARYGIGSAVQDRMVFGARGAPWVSVVRLGVVLLWAAAWALEHGEWTSRLAAMAVGKQSLGYQVPGFSSLSVMTMVAAVLLFVLAWMLAEAGIGALATRINWLLFVCLGLGVGMALFGWYQARGMPAFLLPPAAGFGTAWSSVRLLEDCALLLLWSAPGLLAASEWSRCRLAPQRRSMLPRLAPFMVVPAGLTLALLGGLMMHASTVVRGDASAHAIPDAAGFGGVGAGALAGLWTLLLFLASVSLVGMHAPARALLGVIGKRLGERGATGLVFFLSLLALPQAAWLLQSGANLLWLFMPAALLLALHFVEEMRRKKRLVLEDLYLASSAYGPTFGVSLAAIMALGVGLLLHPWLWQHPWAASLRPHIPGLGQRPYPEWQGVLYMAMAAALVYLALKPVERRVAGALAAWCSKARAGQQLRRQPKQINKRQPVLLRHETSATEGVTNPRFVINQAPQHHAGEGTADKDSAALMPNDDDRSDWGP